MSTLVTEIEGSYKNEKDGPFQVGVSSGSERVGLGASNQLAIVAAVSEKKPTPKHKEFGLSLTPDQAEEIGRALIEHAERVRART